MLLKWKRTFNWPTQWADAVKGSQKTWKDSFKRSNGLKILITNCSLPLSCSFRKHCFQNFETPNYLQASPAWVSNRNPFSAGEGESWWRRWLSVWKSLSFIGFTWPTACPFYNYFDPMWKGSHNDRSIRAISTGISQQFIPSISILHIKKWQWHITDVTMGYMLIWVHIESGSQQGEKFTNTEIYFATL